MRVGEQWGGCRWRDQRGLRGIEGRVHAQAGAVVVVELEGSAEIDDEPGELTVAGGDVDVVIGLAPEQRRTECGVKSEGDDAVDSEWASRDAGAEALIALREGPKV